MATESHSSLPFDEPEHATTSTQGYNAMQDGQATGPSNAPTTSSSPPQQQQQATPEVSYRKQPSSRSSPVSSRGDARSVYSSATSMTRKLVVFATPAKYANVVWALLAIPLLAVLISIILLHPRTDIRNSGSAWALGWTLILIMVLYMAVLPKQIDVRSNGTVGIKTFLLTFHIDGVVRAYQAGIGREDFLRPRIKFATSIEERVILRRNHGKWDVVVSPEDVEGFLKAVEEVVKEHGDGEDEDVDNAMIDAENNVVVVPNRKSGYGKPDLASTDESERPALV